ncbi:MAG: hypothetical protein HZA54_08110 [Planctomycetes bacterium]|nr:hypothetical protein [Planctomycetota bacterium]
MRRPQAARAPHFPLLLAPLLPLLLAGCSTIWRQADTEKHDLGVRESGRSESTLRYGMLIEAVPHAEWPELRVLLLKAVAVTITYEVSTQDVSVETRVGAPFAAVPDNPLFGLAHGILDTTVGPIIAPGRERELRRVPVKGSERTHETRQVVADVRAAAGETLALEGAPGAGECTTDDQGLARFMAPPAALDRGVTVRHPASGTSVRMVRVRARRVVTTPDLPAAPDATTPPAPSGGAAGPRALPYALTRTSALLVAPIEGATLPREIRLGVAIDPVSGRVAHALVDELSFRCAVCGESWTVRDVAGTEVLSSCPRCRRLVRLELSLRQS